MFRSFLSFYFGNYSNWHSAQEITNEKIKPKIIDVDDWLRQNTQNTRKWWISENYWRSLYFCSFVRHSASKAKMSPKQSLLTSQSLNRNISSGIAAIANAAGRSRRRITHCFSLGWSRWQETHKLKQGKRDDEVCDGGWTDQQSVAQNIAYHVQRPKSDISTIDHRITLKQLRWLMWAFYIIFARRSILVAVVGDDGDLESYIGLESLSSVAGWSYSSCSCRCLKWWYGSLLQFRSVDFLWTLKWKRHFDFHFDFRLCASYQCSIHRSLSDSAISTDFFTEVTLFLRIISRVATSSNCSLSLRAFPHCAQTRPIPKVVAQVWIVRRADWNLPLLF